MKSSFVIEAHAVRIDLKVTVIYNRRWSQLEKGLLKKKKILFGCVSGLGNEIDFFSSVY